MDKITAVKTVERKRCDIPGQADFLPKREFHAVIVSYSLSSVNRCRFYTKRRALIKYDHRFALICSITA